MTDALIVSYGKDTNGQNARYAAASEKHGDDDSVITALAVGKYDPAAVVARYAIAAEKHPDAGLRIQSAHKQVYDPYDFPGGIRWDRSTRAQVKLLAQQADVIHLNNSDLAARELGVYRKPLLLHQHGSLFRNDPAKWLGVARQRKMVQAVSTIDLMKPAPEALRWLPTAYDIGELRNIGLLNDREPDGRVRIVHCPTGSSLPGQSKFYKHTELFMAATDELIAEGLPIDVIVVRDAPQSEVLRAKAAADIVYDQLLYGYGCNSVEAWGMGKPVISGADDWTTKEMRRLWGDTPYQHATVKTLKAVIKKMVLSADLRYEVAQRGVQHVMRYHDELPALTILAELYHEAMVLRNQPRIQGKGVLFSSRKRKVMFFGGQSVDFTNGTVEVTDIEVVESLRQRVKTRPMFGITEEEGVA